MGVVEVTAAPRGRDGGDGGDPRWVEVCLWVIL